jgi:uncharacterized membrane protein YphA (DoxX/SURF4 family)
VLLGALFVFSGVAKGVDPMGSAIKIGEYLNAFGMDALRGAEYFFSIALSTGEAVLGLLLIFGIRIRATSTVASVLMLGMTMLTLLIAMTNPVADCGCFGEAIKLSNWGTFFKNLLILLPLSIIVMFNAWISLPRPGTWYDFLWGGIFVVFFTAISLYGLRHLPVIDFLPYKIGVNIPEQMEKSGAAPAEETRLLYREIRTGRLVEFTMADTTWYDSSTWEYVDTIVEARPATMGQSVSDFAILDGGEDITVKLLREPGVLMLLCVSDPAALSADCSRALCDAAREGLQKGYRVIAITPVAMPTRQRMLIDQNTAVDYYNIDDVVLKSLLRAKNGLVVLDSGTIVDKRNCRDIPVPGRFPDYAGDR